MGGTPPHSERDWGEFSHPLFGSAPPRSGGEFSGVWGGVGGAILGKICGAPPHFGGEFWVKMGGSGGESARRRRKIFGVFLAVFKGKTVKIVIFFWPPEAARKFWGGWEHGQSGGDWGGVFEISKLRPLPPRAGGERDLRGGGQGGGVGGAPDSCRSALAVPRRRER